MQLRPYFSSGRQRSNSLSNDRLLLFGLCIAFLYFIYAILSSYQALNLSACEQKFHQLENEWNQHTAQLMRQLARYQRKENMEKNTQEAKNQIKPQTTTKAGGWRPESDSEQPAKPDTVPRKKDNEKYAGADADEHRPSVDSDSVNSDASLQQTLHDIPVLLFCANRAENLRKTIDSLLSVRPAAGSPIYISQDGNVESVNKVINTFVEGTQQLTHLKFSYQRSASADQAAFEVYYRIAQHYGWGLTQIFSSPKNYSEVIIVEDDMLFAPDFFSYFRAMSAIVQKDPSLLCASGWNDNGQARFVENSHQLYRSDVFPGLGWLMTRKLWEELSDHWAAGFWDDWLREPKQRKGRQCIFPEVNRVYTFGIHGASGGQFFDRYLKDIKLNEQKIDWQTEDLTHHHNKAAYDQQLERTLNAAAVCTSIAQCSSLELPLDRDAVILYGNVHDLDEVLNSLGLMSDHKAGIPRASYRGVIVFRMSGRRIFLRPLFEDSLHVADLHLAIPTASPIS